MTKTIIIESSSGKIHLTREEFDIMVEDVQSEKDEIQQFQFPSLQKEACYRGTIGCKSLHLNSDDSCEYRPQNI